MKATRPWQFYGIFIMVIIGLSGCLSAGAEVTGNVSAIVAEATVPPTFTSVPTLLPEMPQTWTPTPIPTDLPTSTPAPVTPTAESSRDTDDVISSLSENSQTSLPSLRTTAVPQPSVTASPSPTLDPAANEWKPPFEDGETIKINGSGFGPAVQANPNLDFAKIGFHVGPGGTMKGLTEWMESLDAQGIPFFLKSVDAAGPLLEAQNIAKASGVPHVLVYRRAGGYYELPNYNMPPEESAREHWELQKAAFPPELDPRYVWIETMNEVDRNRSDWLGAFALETAKLALRDGYKWSAFGWSSGEPEYDDWQQPRMAEFLAFAAQHPDQISIAIHEYSFINDDLMYNYPFQLGRVQLLFLAADRLNIPRPTVLITEFGWEYQSVPSPGTAIAQLEAAAALYATYPQIKGAAIWYLGPGFGGVARETQLLIEPTLRYIESTYFQHPAYKPISPALFLDYWETRGIEP
ncbi:MAG: hypothetical protein AAF633_26080 [Chloroflexota bacterium]